LAGRPSGTSPADLGEWLLHRSGYRLSLSERIERWFGLPAWQLAIMFAVFAGVCAGIVSL
jgi:hypothetical protein